MTVSQYNLTILVVVPAIMLIVILHALALRRMQSQMEFIMSNCIGEKARVE